MNKALSPLSIALAIITVVTLFTVVALNIGTTLYEENKAAAYQTNVAELRQTLEIGDADITDEVFFKSLDLLEKCIAEDRFLQEESELILTWIVMAYAYDFEIANSLAQEFIQPLLPKLPKGEFYTDIKELSENFDTPENNLAAMIEFDRLFREKMGTEQTEEDREAIRAIFNQE